MEDYNKIIESLDIRFINAQNVEILKPIAIDNNYEVENYLFLVTGGEIQYGKDKEVATESDVVFIPGGRTIFLGYGAGSLEVLSKDDFVTDRNKYLKSYKEQPKRSDHYSYVSFNTRAFDSVSFFSSLDIPPFKIEENYKLASLVKQINDEVRSNMPGSSRIIKLLTENMTIELIRYILSNSLFVEKLATNSTYFKDARLIDIFTFIKENISENLSNRVLAKIANVSEDYIGQYFKMLTGINPQDYIEYQRMEVAVTLLRTSKKSIKEISKAVGYRDTAYFCRRFKMVFGIPAGKMRRRESLMNV